MGSGSRLRYRMEVEKGIRKLLAKYRQIQLVLTSRDYSSITSTLTLQVPPMQTPSLNSDYVKGLLRTLRKGRLLLPWIFVGNPVGTQVD
jgi:hypothetical protein